MCKFVLGALLRFDIAATDDKVSHVFVGIYTNDEGI